MSEDFICVYHNHSACPECLSELDKFISEQVKKIKTLEENLFQMQNAAINLNQKIKEITALHVEVSGRNVDLYCENLKLKENIKDLVVASENLSKHLDIVLGDVTLSGTVHLNNRLKEVLSKHKEMKE